MLRKPFLFGGMEDMLHLKVLTDFQEGVIIKIYFIAEQQILYKVIVKGPSQWQYNSFGLK